MMSNYSPKHPASGGSRAKASDGDKKKQKILIIVILIVLAVIIAAALIFVFVPGAESGISKLFGGSNNGYVPETQDGTTNLTPYYENGILPTAADRHDITIIYGGGANGADLLGRWQVNDHDTYIFDGQGRGIFLALDNNGEINKEFTFTYSAENGKLGIDYDGENGSDYEFDYTLVGDTLTLSRSGQTYTMKRVADE